MNWTTRVVEMPGVPSDAFSQGERMSDWTKYAAENPRCLTPGQALATLPDRPEMVRLLAEQEGISIEEADTMLSRAVVSARRMLVEHDVGRPEPDYLSAPMEGEIDHG